MPEQNKLVGSLSLARRAGKLAWGFDSVKENVMKGRAFLVVMTEDLSPKTKMRVERFCEDLTECREMPLTQDDLWGLAHKPTGVFALLDDNFAKLCLKHLGNTQKEDICE